MACPNIAVPSLFSWCHVLSFSKHSSLTCDHYNISWAFTKFSLERDAVTLSFWQKLQQLNLQQESWLIIIEKDNPKKGVQSAGVKRQY